MYSLFVVATIVWGNFVMGPCFVVRSMCRATGGQGSGPPPPLGIYKYIGFLSNTGPDPFKITKLPCWAISGPPAKRHLNGVSLAGQ